MNNKTLSTVVRITYAMEIIGLWIVEMLLLPLILLFNIAIVLWLWITSKSLKDSIVIASQAWMVRLKRFTYLTKTELNKTFGKFES